MCTSPLRCVDLCGCVQQARVVFYELPESIDHRSAAMLRRRRNTHRRGDIEVALALIQQRRPADGVHRRPV